jgi:flagellar assembly protein FliH
VETYAFPTLEGTPVAAPPVPQPQVDLDALAAEARAEAAAELEPIREALDGAIKAFDQARDELVAIAEQRAVELALALTDKILHTALEVDPSLVVSVATGALRRVVHGERVVLEVNPEDVELVEEALGGRVEVAPERRVPRGGCVVRTSEGEIDARIDEQLARAADVLRHR